MELTEIIANNKDKLAKVFSECTDKPYIQYSIGKLDNAKVPSLHNGRNFIVFIYEVARALDDINIILKFKEEHLTGLNAKYTKDASHKEQRTRELDQGIFFVERIHKEGIQENYNGKG